jgi:predicted aspartyl protease
MHVTRLHTTLVAALLVAALHVPSAALQGGTNIFVLKLVGQEFVIEAVPIAVNEVKVVQTSEEVLDVIFPPGPGQSAGLASPGDGRALVARNTGQEMRIEVRSPDGSTRELPARTLTDLAGYDVRVNVTGGRHRAAFLILQNETIQRDVGPVANMFSGRLPAEVLQSAYVVQTETYRHDAGPLVTGTVPLEIDRWPFVRVTLPDGAEADFVVDIGAATTTVDQSLLPDGVEITEASMVEYSAAGKRTLKYTPGGATGQVQTVVGHASLDSIALGELTVRDVTCDVLKELPGFFGRPVGGIIGMDVLRRCHHLALTLGTEQPGIHFGSHRAAVDDAIGLPFAFVSTHLVIEGAANGIPVFFILDSGAPSTFLDEAAAASAGVAGDASRADSARGLDEGSVSTTPALIGLLALGRMSFEDVPCRISSLSAFDPLRGDDQYAGLLGNDFFARFSSIEIDFDRRTVRFVL